MTVSELNPLEVAEWDEFVMNHPLSSSFHTRGWLKALQCTYGFEPAALVTKNADGKLTDALVYCRVNSWITGRRIISLPFSDHCEPLIRSDDAITTLTDPLLEVTDSTNCKYVELRPRVMANHALPQFGRGETFYLHRIDLRPGADEVFRRFHRDSIQRKIRRSEREKLRLEAGRDAKIIHDFFQLMLRTRRRHGLPTQPIRWFHNLAQCLGDSVTIRLAYKDRRAIAGILMLEHRKTLIYKYGASDERFHNMGGMVAVFWDAVQDGLAHGFEEIDMGRTDLDNPGLSTFKEHWGATRTNLTYWRYPAPAPAQVSRPLWPMRIAQKACNHAPNFVLSAVGSLLYRHVG